MERRDGNPPARCGSMLLGNEEKFLHGEEEQEVGKAVSLR
jgi:hypothetical protein